MTMKNHMAIICAALSAVALAFVQVGCAREISSTKSSRVSSDGTVRSQEKTVTRAADGSTVTKTQESKTTVHNKP